MENIPHSLPKRSFTSSSIGGFTTHKSVYDDVFGGAQKCGLPTLAPRLEDYAEIFGGFHASRSCSIPVLDIPLIDDDLELHLNAGSSGFNYAEVFGGSRGLDCVVSFEDVVRQSSGGYDDSDEPWSPAQSGSISDEVDPLAGSDTSHRLSDGDAHHLESSRQFNVSYNKSSQKVMETMVAGTTHVTKFGAAPEYTRSHYETPVTWSGGDEYCTKHATDDINTHANEYDPSEKHGSWTSPPFTPFMTVSDISLRTKPSRLPPPSRPPPALAVKKGVCDRSNSKHKVSKSYAFERVANDSDKLFFDVEVDVTSSAEGMERRNKESIKKKNELGSHTKWKMEDVTKVEEKMNKEVGLHSSFKGNEEIQSDGTVTRDSTSSVEDGMRSGKVTEEFPEPQGKQYSNHITDKSDGPVAWREETEYFEVVEKKISSEPFETVEDHSIFMQFGDPEEAYGSLKILDFEHKENRTKSKLTMEAPTCVEKVNEPKMARGDCHWVDNQRRKKTQIRFGHRKDFQEKVILNKLAGVQQPEKSGKLQIGHVGYVDREVGTLCNVNEVGPELKLSASSKRFEFDTRFIDAVRMKENNEKYEEKIVREEYCRRIENVGRAEIRERVERIEQEEGIRKQQFGAFWKESENKLKESHALKENEMIVKDAYRHGENGKSSRVVVGHERKEGEILPLEVHKEKERLIDVGKPKLHELTFGMVFQHSAIEKEHKVTPEAMAMKERKRDASIREDNYLTATKPESEPGNDGEICKTQVNQGLSGDTCTPELVGDAEEIKPVESNGHEREVKWDLESDVLIQGDQLKVFEGTSKFNEGITSKLAGNHNYPLIAEKARAAFSCNGNVGLKPQCSFSAIESEAGMLDSIVSEGKFNRFGNNKDEVQDENTHIAINNAAEYSSLPKQMTDSNTGGNGRVFKRVMPDKTTSTEQIISTEDDAEQKLKGAQVINEEVDIRDRFTPCLLVKESVVNGRKWEDVSSKLELNGDSFRASKNATKQSIERNNNDMKENLVMKDQKVGERIRREIDLENEQIRKREEEREREREREKDRMAVDKAALEAHERSYVEAREKTERANSEVRQRAILVAREKLEKTSVEARHRAERAAVERATAEARQRAVEKSMAEKDAFGRVEKSVSDRFSASYRFADTKQSSLSNDIHFQNAGFSSGSRHEYVSAHVGAGGESPQRCKARLDRYRRTADRAANALAEKNRRDLLVQKEREERNRVAEPLDVEVKRWSSGKEGNLRALLSTLQYILGPDCGWQPVPLTEVVTSAAVKKAYRKATLCVHPDKLQQRGASIQQKYVCEKVFDLLKEAWSKFNSEER